GIGRVSPWRLLTRWLAFLVLFGFLAALVAPTHPARERLGVGVVAGAILARSSLAALALIVLAEVTPFSDLLRGLRHLGVPSPLLPPIHFMHRYAFVLAEELAGMAKARRSRNFRRKGRLDWGLLGGLLGMLLLRSLERAERVHAAMLARGWDGTLRHLEPVEA